MLTQRWDSSRRIRESGFAASRPQTKALDNPDINVNDLQAWVNIERRIAPCIIPRVRYEVRSNQWTPSDATIDILTLVEPGGCLRIDRSRWNRSCSGFRRALAVLPLSSSTASSTSLTVGRTVTSPGRSLRRLSRSSLGHARSSWLRRARASVGS